MKKTESNMNSKHSGLGRREFLKRLGLGGAAVAAAGAASCSTQKQGDQGEAALGPIPTDKMTHRITPTSGDSVSLLGYGCMRWPTVPVEGGEEGEDRIDQEEVNRLVDYALEHGVNYFDTSPVYCKGRSEEATGIALARHPRDKYFIATKLSNFAKQTLSREASMQMYHDSFKKLQTDYIDYYLLHSVGGGEDPFEYFNQRYIDNGMLDFLVKEREAGRIRNLGFSFHGDVKFFDYALSLHDKYKWDFVQIQLNYFDWKHAHEINEDNVNAEYLYGELEKRGIPAVIMEPLLGGRLAKVHDHVASRLKQQEPDRSVASWAFRYCGTMPGVLTVLSGMTYMEHLQDNLRSFCPLVPLSDSDLKYLYDTADIMLQFPTIPCNDCKYCMPCPYGIDIPAIMVHYNKCVNEGNVPEDTQAANYREARRAFLVGYDRSVPKLRQASHCTGCNQCSPHCPQKIDIPGQLARIDKYADNLRQGKL